MSFEIKEMNAGGIDPIAVGSYPVRVQCIAMYGMQPMTEWDTGAPKAPEKRMAITYEFPTETIERTNDDGTVSVLPRRLTKEYKVSQHKKAGLMGVISVLKPDAVRITDLLDCAGSVTVGRTSGGKAKVTNVSPIMKGMDVAPLMEGSNSFDIDNPEEGAFKRLMPFQQEMMTKCLDYDGFADEWLPKKEEDNSDY